MVRLFGQRENICRSEEDFQEHYFREIGLVLRKYD
jgi:hypothetical protein